MTNDSLPLEWQQHLLNLLAKSVPAMNTTVSPTRLPTRLTQVSRNGRP